MRVEACGTCLQVVGLRNGWQTALVMAGLTTKIHAKRLAQGTEVVLELRSQGAPFPCTHAGTSADPTRCQLESKALSICIVLLRSMDIPQGLHSKEAC